MRCSIELTISYVYLALHSYADRDNVGLPGFAAWFKDESDGERDHAQLLLNFQVRCPMMVCQSVSVPVWSWCRGHSNYRAMLGPSQLDASSGKCEQGASLYWVCCIWRAGRPLIWSAHLVAAEQARRPREAAHARCARDGVSCALQPCSTMYMCPGAMHARTFKP